MVRLDRNGIVEIYIRRRWRDVPTSVTIAAICLLSVGFFAAVIHGPAWLAMPALILLIAQFTVLFGGLIWYGAQAHARWFVSRWYRPLVGVGLASMLIVAEAAGFRWHDGEPLNGYWWAAIVAAFCGLAGFFGYRQGASTPSD